MTPVQEAKELIIKCTKPAERIDIAKLHRALGMVLTNDIWASMDLPDFSNSAVDGYGVSLSKNEAVNQWTLAGEIKAGDSISETLKPGQAIRIFTGAKIPEGVDAVVMQEFITIEGKKIRTNHTVKPGDNIRLKGSQITKGALALKSGTRINPGVIGFLNGMGIEEAPVYAHPTVSVIVTGSEVVRPGDILKSGKIYDSNSGVLLSVLSGCKIEKTQIFFSEDKETELKKIISEALITSDIVILSGGISVGKYDLVKKTLEEMGVNTQFHKVAQKPGKPLYFGTINDKLIFGLPGNPAAVLTCFYEFVYPAIRKMQRYEKLFLPTGVRKLRTDLSKKKDLGVFLKGKVTDKYAEVLEGQESFILKSFSDANALIYIPAGIEKIEKETEVEVHLLPEY